MALLTSESLCALEGAAIGEDEGGCNLKLALDASGPAG